VKARTLAAAPRPDRATLGARRVIADVRALLLKINTETFIPVHRVYAAEEWRALACWSTLRALVAAFDRGESIGPTHRFIAPGATDVPRAAGLVAAALADLAEARNIAVDLLVLAAHRGKGDSTGALKLLALLRGSETNLDEARDLLGAPAGEVRS
jgi:hypothetical protein